MKKKKMIMITTAVIAMIFVVGIGVTAMVSKNWSEKISENFGWNEKNSFMADFEAQNNKSTGQLTAYDYNTFRFLFGLRNFVLPNASSQIYILEHFNESFPIELIKKIDSDHICVVYKLSRENGENVLAYVIFERTIAYFTKEDGVDKKGTYERWSKTGELYFVTQSLSSADFDNVKIGDSASSVCAIDSAVSFDADYAAIDAAQMKYNFTSYRILSDGIMIIEFEGPMYQENSEKPLLSAYTVSEKAFYPYHSDEVPEEIATVIHSPNLLN